MLFKQATNQHENLLSLRSLSEIDCVAFFFMLFPLLLSILLLSLLSGILPLTLATSGFPRRSISELCCSSFLSSTTCEVPLICSSRQSLSLSFCSLWLTE